MVKNSLARFSLYIVGQRQTGKTTFVKTLLGYPYNPQEPPTNMPVAAAELTVTWPQSRATGSCRLCDTSGGPELAQAVRSFMRGHMIYILVCSVRMRPTFDALFQYRDAILANNPRARIAVIGTGADVGAAAQVHQVDFEGLCQSRIPYFVVSAYDRMQSMNALSGILGFWEPAPGQEDNGEPDMVESFVYGQRAGGSGAPQQMEMREPGEYGVYVCGVRACKNRCCRRSFRCCVCIDCSCCCEECCCDCCDCCCCCCEGCCGDDGCCKGCYKCCQACCNT